MCKIAFIRVSIQSLLVLTILRQSSALLNLMLKKADYMKRDLMSQTVKDILKRVLTGGLILFSILFFFKTQTINNIILILFLVTNILLHLCEKFLIYCITHFLHKKSISPSNIIIVGTGKRAVKFSRVIRTRRNKEYNIVGFVDKETRLKGKVIDGIKVIGLIEEFPEILTKIQVDEVFFIIPRKWLDKIEKAIFICMKVGIKIRISADFYSYKIAKTTLEEFNNLPFLTANLVSHSADAIAFKRLFDLLFSLLFLILSTPFFLIVSIGIKLTSPGPVFFLQERCGLNGRRFNVLKFRTMIDNAEISRPKLEKLNEMSGPAFKMENDPRVTMTGKFLRKFSLDEIPQFINVLKGDMSLVGPRPPIPSEVDKYDLWQRRRLSVLPGITCLWQIKGRNKIDFNKWMKLDLEYIDKWSFSLDLKILFKTIPVILKGSGI